MFQKTTPSIFDRNFCGVNQFSIFFHWHIPKIGLLAKVVTILLRDVTVCTYLQLNTKPWSKTHQDWTFETNGYVLKVTNMVNIGCLVDQTLTAPSTQFNLHCSSRIQMNQSYQLILIDQRKIL